MSLTEIMMEVPMEHEQNVCGKERETFIEDFFQIMTSTGAFTLTDLTEIDLRHALEIVQSLSQNREVHKFALSFLTNCFADLRRLRKN